MSNHNFPGSMPRARACRGIPAAEVSLSRPFKARRRKKQSPEILALQAMGDMIESYRRDILRLRREFKKLRAHESSQELVNLHIRHRMQEIDESIQRGIEGWAALRDDYFMQRACLLKQQKAAKKTRKKAEKQESAD